MGDIAEIAEILRFAVAVANLTIERQRLLYVRFCRLQSPLFPSYSTEITTNTGALLGKLGSFMLLGIKYSVGLLERRLGRIESATTSNRYRPTARTARASPSRREHVVGTWSSDSGDQVTGLVVGFEPDCKRLLFVGCVGGSVRPTDNQHAVGGFVLSVCSARVPGENSDGSLPFLCLDEELLVAIDQSLGVSSESLQGVFDVGRCAAVILDGATMLAQAMDLAVDEPTAVV